MYWRDRIKWNRCVYRILLSLSTLLRSIFLIICNYQRLNAKVVRQNLKEKKYRQLANKVENRIIKKKV